MRPHMIDGDKGYRKTEGHCLSETKPNGQRPHKARPGCAGNRIHLTGTHLCLFERCINHNRYIFLMHP